MLLHDAVKQVHTIISKLYYCNAFLCRCLVHLVQTAAVLIEPDNLTLLLLFYLLHWLPVKYCTDYKMLLMCYKTLNGLNPELLSKCWVYYNLSHRHWSKGACFLLVLIINEHHSKRQGFFLQSLIIRRHILSGIKNIPANGQDSDSASIFKSRLKTYLALF